MFGEKKKLHTHIRMGDPLVGSNMVTGPANTMVMVDANHGSTKLLIFGITSPKYPKVMAYGLLLSAIISQQVSCPESPEKKGRKCPSLMGET